MLRLMKYLKKSTIPIIFVLVLLVLQAYCDLALPTYTSNIVNVGIQQGGITEAVPRVLRESTMNQIFMFVNQKDRLAIENAYVYVAKENISDDRYQEYLKKYPGFVSDNIYVRENQEAASSSYEVSMGKALMLVTMLKQDSDLTKAMKESIFSGMSTEAQNQPLLDLIAALPTVQRTVIIEKLQESFLEFPESMLNSSTVLAIKQEYEELEMDVDQFQSDYIFRTGIKMVGLAFLGMAISIIVGYIASRVAAGFGRDLRGSVFERVVSFSNAEFDQFSTASLITRSTNDIQQVQMVIVLLLRMVAYAPILGVGGIIKVLNTNASMAWVIALAVGVITLLILVLFSLAMPKFKRLQKLVDRLNLVTREILSGLPVIRAFSTQEHERKRFDKANIDLTKTSLFVNRVMAFMMPAMMFVMNGIMILILWEGGHGIDSGAMLVGDMMAYIQYAMQIIMAFLMLCMISIILPRAAVSGKRITEVLDVNPSIHDPKTTTEFAKDKKGVVEFRNVSFRYPNAEEDVLHHISFTARPGETTAIIGSTGSGKSSLLQLIPRLYDVTDGELLVDGVDVRKIPLHTLREKLGYVPQKGILFRGTIDSNLRYGKQDASKEDIERAARIAQATEFIEEKKDKYEEAISQGGTNVSGGQKQRLSIARALAKVPEIFIFDDSFSALDYKTDAKLRETLKNEISESTVLIVSQRISTIMSAEQILVLDEGSIVGMGSHKELLNSCEVYRQIASSQLSEEELRQVEKAGDGHEQ